MKKQVKYIVIFLIIDSLLYVLNYFKKANSASIIDYETEQPFYTSIKKEVVATGKLNPEDEIQLKPQVSGIIDKIYVEEGDLVNKGDLIANIRVVPNEQSLINAKSRLESIIYIFRNYFFYAYKIFYQMVMIYLFNFCICITIFYKYHRYTC